MAPQSPPDMLELPEPPEPREPPEAGRFIEWLFGGNTSAARQDAGRATEACTSIPAAASGVRGSTPPPTPPRRKLDVFALTPTQREGRRHASAVFQEIRDVALRMTTARNTVLMAAGLTTAQVVLLEQVAQMIPRLCTVSDHARILRLARQSVQRVVNALVRYQLLALRDNPQHRRARLVVLTAQGRSYLAAARAFEAQWLTDVVGASETRDVQQACWLLRSLRARAGRPEPDHDG